MSTDFKTILWKVSQGYNDSWSQIDPEVIQLFGEEIVRICVSKCNDGYSQISIRQHFGLEDAA
jgi:hypothetical protein